MHSFCSLNYLHFVIYTNTIFAYYRIHSPDYMTERKSYFSANSPLFEHYFIYSNHFLFSTVSEWKFILTFSTLKNWYAYWMNSHPNIVILYSLEKLNKYRTNECSATARHICLMVKIIRLLKNLFEIVIPLELKLIEGQIVVTETRLQLNFDMRF